MDPLQLCKCLADETRLQIMVMLWQRPELCVCEIVERLDLPQPTVSRHLARLRSCGLLQLRKDSRWVYYRLPDDLPSWARDALAALVAPVMQRYTRTFAGVRCGCN